MSDTTLVAVSNDSGVRVPSITQLHVFAGQSVTFRAVDAGSALYFSPDLIEILTPTPETHVSLTPGNDLTYTFSSADPGAYEILFQDPDQPAPQTFDPIAADRTSFLLLLKSSPGVSGPHPSPTIPAMPPPPPGITSNPIQTLSAAAQPHGIMEEAEAERFSITSNPIQT